jgi:hypothetical protein
MKIKSIWLVAFLFVAAVFAGADDKKNSDGKKGSDKPKAEKQQDMKQPPAMDEQTRAMMDAFMKAGQPGMNHRFLAQLEGHWKAETKSWMGPGEPTVSEGESVNEMILGGRYLRQEFTGTFMGEKFQGWGITAYDNTLKKFTTVWIDSMSTSISTGSGELDADGKVLTTVQSYSDPMSGTQKTSREVLRIVSPTTFVMEMYETGPEGKELLTMEITYTKSKGK